ncbi:terpene synthase family protein [Allokutzneria albata]|uniref:Bonnadiene synthase n=1 Tax=Allokutzneria albata TaxID=211114 RepID=BDS_ALLAB|nr:hypothetical protein [Allokutzneria albata]SDM62252.1 hypothetical protein SAMN04489726_2557 [Allokutzneria albata]
MNPRTVQPLDVPPLYCPIPPEIHPDLALIEKRSIDWFQGFGVFPGEAGRALLRGWQFPALAARAYPEEDAERVRIVADFVHWTTFDDVLIDTDHSHVDDVLPGAPPDLLAVATKMVRMLEVPDAALLPGDPWIRSLMDLRRRLGTIAAPEQMARWTGAFREYLLAATWKRFCRQARRLPSLADYVTMRTADGGVQMYVALSEVVGGYRLTDRDLATPAVRAVTEMALTLIAWDNDLFSHYKESLTAGPCINLIDVIAGERGCSLEDAVPVAVAMRDRVMCRYMAVRERTERDLGVAARRYVRSLDRWIAANIDMSATSTRYTNPLNRPATEMPRARFTPARTDLPSDDSPLALPFPDIAWWWD